MPKGSQVLIPQANQTTGLGLTVNQGSHTNDSLSLVLAYIIYKFISSSSVHVYQIVNLPYYNKRNDISMFRNYSFNFGQNVTKCGRNMERCRERNIAEPKFELKSFHLSSCVFYGAAISKR